MTIDETSIDTEPSKRDLAAALHAVDNMQALLNQLAARVHAHAIAINIGVSQNRQVSLYVTADDGVDEVSVARAVDVSIERVMKRLTLEGRRAAMVRLVVAQQWAVACALINGLGAYDDKDVAVLLDDGRPFIGWWLPDDNDAVVWAGRIPCAVDVVADLLGAP